MMVKGWALMVESQEFGDNDELEGNIVLFHADLSEECVESDNRVTRWRALGNGLVSA
jgi:hypothetical protein